MAKYIPPKESWFQTDRKEALTAKLTLRIAPSLNENLKSIENWQEEVRKTLEKLVEAKSA